MSESIVDVFGRASAGYDSVGVDFFTPMGSAPVEAPETMEILARHAEGAPPPRRNDNQFETAESITDALRGAGFSTISVREVTFHTRLRIVLAA